MALRSVLSGPKAHAVRWDMRDPRNQETFTEAVKRAHADVLERTLLHDGHKVLRTHVINARRRTNRWGVTIGKEHRESARKIDLAVCMVGARMLRRMPSNLPKHVGVMLDGNRRWAKAVGADTAHGYRAGADRSDGGDGFSRRDPQGHGVEQRGAGIVAYG